MDIAGTHPDYRLDLRGGVLGTNASGSAAASTHELPVLLTRHGD
jgi:hypothetical protein